MQLSTKYFGVIDCPEEELLTFPNGLFGFDEERAFVPLPFHGSNGTLLCFQSVQTPSLAFVAMDPFALKPDYAPVLAPEELALLGVSRSEDLCYYVFCVVREPVADSTVNLRCPIVINPEQRRAMQVILESGGYHMRHRLAEFQHKGDGDSC